MVREYVIEQGNWNNEYPVTLTVLSDEEAETQDFEMEIEWLDDDEAADMGFEAVGTGYLDDEPFCQVYKEGRYWTAYSLDGYTDRDSSLSPFEAFAHLVYTMGSW